MIVRKMIENKRFKERRAGYPSYEHANELSVLIGRK